jgi:hypothetical protein
MKRQTKFWGLFFLAGLIVFLGVVPFLTGDNPKPTDILLKAKFISGYYIDPAKPETFIEYKIRNDIDGAFYMNGTSNFIVLRNDPNGGTYGGGYFVLDIVTGTRSPRFVNMDLDVYPGGWSYPCDTCCTRPYFIFPNRINPVPTSRLLMKSTFGYHIKSDDPNVLERDANLFNFVTMAPGQEAFVELDKHEFQVQDSSVTRNYNDSRDTYWIDFPYYVKVKASSTELTSDGKVNGWTITPIAEAIKVLRGYDQQGNPNYDDNPDGTKLVRIFSNSQQKCLHGIFNLDYELYITRQ